MKYEKILNKEELKRVVNQWESTASYMKNQIISYNGDLYKSLTDYNIGIVPDSDLSHWKNLIGETDQTLIQGYLNPEDGKFYEDAEFTEEIETDTEHVYANRADEGGVLKSVSVNAVEFPKGLTEEEFNAKVDSLRFDCRPYAFQYWQDNIAGKTPAELGIPECTDGDVLMLNGLEPDGVYGDFFDGHFSSPYSVLFDYYLYQMATGKVYCFTLDGVSLSPIADLSKTAHKHFARTIKASNWVESSDSITQTISLDAIKDDSYVSWSLANGYTKAQYRAFVTNEIVASVEVGKLVFTASSVPTINLPIEILIENVTDEVIPKLVLPNLLKNSSFELPGSGSQPTNWSHNIGTFTVSDEYKLYGNFSGKALANTNFIQDSITQDAPDITNHKFYYSIDACVPDSVYIQMRATDSQTGLLFSESHYSELNMEWQRFSNIFVYPATDFRAFYIDVELPDNVTGYFDGAILVDLTEKFGAGNEPTKEWCDENIKYEDLINP